MNEYVRRWMNQNDENNGALVANTASAVACLAIVLLALVVSIQLVFSPINNDRDLAVDATSIEITLAPGGVSIEMVPAALVVKQDGPSSDQADDILSSNSYETDNSVLDGPSSDNSSDNPQDPYGIGDQSLDTPFYTDPNGYVLRYETLPETRIGVAVFGGCYTNSGEYLLVLDGLTPYGKYTAQTDWSGIGSFGYGDANVADANGRGVYTWSCFERNMTGLPTGMYGVHFTDLTTGFGRTIGLRVD